MIVIIPYNSDAESPVFVTILFEAAAITQKCEGSTYHVLDATNKSGNKTRSGWHNCANFDTLDPQDLVDLVDLVD
jgi:hypothetical protein